MHNERCRSRIEAELAKSADTEVDAQERIRKAVARNVWHSAAVKVKDEKNVQHVMANSSVMLSVLPR